MLRNDSSDVDQDVIALDLDREHRKVAVGGGPKTFAGGNMELRLVQWAFHLVAIDEALGQVGLGMRADAFQRVNVFAETKDRQQLVANLDLKSLVGLHILGRCNTLPSHSNSLPTEPCTGRPHSRTGSSD